MNAQLEHLFEQYQVDEKNRHEIRQMYGLLSEEKQSHLLQNFEGFVSKLLKIDLDLEIERDILLDQAVENIKDKILKNRKKGASEKVQKEIQDLKEQI